MGCRNATLLNAPSDNVWSALRDFHDLSWSATVENVERIGDRPGTEVGARRVLNGAFHETLHELDDQNRRIRYSIDDGPGPLERGKIHGYVGELSVVSVTVSDGAEQSVVIWNSDWESEDGGVAEFCDPIYKALLSDLKKHFT